MKTIRLYGRLGAKFGREFHFDVQTPREAVAALCSQIKGFQKWMSESHLHGVAYAVFCGGRNLSQEDLYFRADEEIRFAPVLMGSKQGGVLQVILGIVLIVVGVILDFTPAAAASPYFYEAGIAMLAGGLIQMLSPHPKKSSAGDGSGNTPNYAFSGPINTEAQGHPVPLLYGRLRVGSAVVSAGIDVKDSSTSYIVGGVGVGGGGGGGDMNRTRVEVV